MNNDEIISDVQRTTHSTSPDSDLESSPFSPSFTKHLPENPTNTDDNDSSSSSSSFDKTSSDFHFVNRRDLRRSYSESKDVVGLFCSLSAFPYIKAIFVCRNQFAVS